MAIQKSIHDLQNEEHVESANAKRVVNVDGNGDIVATSILDDYALADFDVGEPIYVGKLDKDGNWLIKKIDTTIGQALYAKGGADYATNWGDKASLTYDTFENTF